MLRFFLLLLFGFSTNAFSQVVSGTVTDEEGNPLAATLVFNLQTEQQSYTNSEGQFTIEATVNHELRWVRKGFERYAKILKSDDFLFPISVSLKRNIQEIEEVEIQQKPTGNLANDTKNYGDKKAVGQLKSATATYIRAKSSPEVLQAKPGEFVQPVGEGISIGASDNKWDDVDFMQNLLSRIEKEFFTEELNLQPTEIQPLFIIFFGIFRGKKFCFMAFVLRMISHGLSRQATIRSMTIKRIYRIIRRSLRNLKGEIKFTLFLR